MKKLFKNLPVLIILIVSVAAIWFIKTSQNTKAERLKDIEESSLSINIDSNQVHKIEILHSAQYTLSAGSHTNEIVDAVSLLNGEYKAVDFYAQTGTGGGTITLFDANGKKIAQYGLFENAEGTLCIGVAYKETRDVLLYQKAGAYAEQLLQLTQIIKNAN